MNTYRVTIYEPEGNVWETSVEAATSYQARVKAAEIHARLAPSAHATRVESHPISTYRVTIHESEGNIWETCLEASTSYEARVRGAQMHARLAPSAHATRVESHPATEREAKSVGVVASWGVLPRRRRW